MKKSAFAAIPPRRLALDRERHGRPLRGKRANWLSASSTDSGVYRDCSSLSSRNHRRTLPRLSGGTETNGRAPWRTAHRFGGNGQRRHVASHVNRALRATCGEGQRSCRIRLVQRRQLCFGGVTAAAHDGYQFAAGIVHELASSRNGRNDSPSNSGAFGPKHASQEINREPKHATCSCPQPGPRESTLPGTTDQ